MSWLAKRCIVSSMSVNQRLVVFSLLQKKNADFGFDLGDVTKGAYAPSPYRGQVLPYSNT